MYRLTDACTHNARPDCLPVPATSANALTSTPDIDSTVDDVASDKDEDEESDDKVDRLTVATGKKRLTHSWSVFE